MDGNDDEIIEYIEYIEKELYEEKNEHDFTKLQLDDCQKSLELCLQKLRETQALNREYEEKIKFYENKIKSIKHDYDFSLEKLKSVTDEKDKYKSIIESVYFKSNTSDKTSNEPINCDYECMNVHNDLKLQDYGLPFEETLQLIEKFEEGQISMIDFSSSLKQQIRTIKQKFEEEIASLVNQLNILKYFEKSSKKELSIEKENSFLQLKTILELQNQLKSLTDMI